MQRQLSVACCIPVGKTFTADPPELRGSRSFFARPTRKRLLPSKSCQLAAYDEAQTSQLKPAHHLLRPDVPCCMYKSCCHPCQDRAATNNTDPQTILPRSSSSSVQRAETLAECRYQRVSKSTMPNLRRCGSNFQNACTFRPRAHHQ